MPTYDVWYTNDKHFSNFIFGEFDEFDTNNPEKTHTLLTTIEADDLEHVFANMQAENWSPNGEARPLIRQLGLSHTSMSMGDMVHVDGRWFVVAHIGFREIDPN
jgi:hypothetical protein